MAPANFETDIKCLNSQGVARTRPSLVPRGMQKGPDMRGFSANPAKNPRRRDLGGGAERLRTVAVARSLSEGKRPRVLRIFRLEIP